MVQPLTAELAALDQLKKIFYLLENYLKCLFSGERSLPFGLLVFENDVKYVHVVFDDQNDSQLSPKSIERQRRDENDEQPITVPGEISVEDPLPRLDWRKFLMARQNKKKVAHLVSEQFLLIASSLGKSNQTLFVGGGFSNSFITKKVTCNEIRDSDTLRSNAMEGDSRVWLHTFRCRGLKCLVCSPDNDTYHIGMPLRNIQKRLCMLLWTILMKLC